MMVAAFDSGSSVRQTAHHTQTLKFKLMLRRLEGHSADVV